jgi:hypothetical protein
LLSGYLYNWWNLCVFSQFEERSDCTSDNEYQGDRCPKQKLEVTRDIFHLARIAQVFCRIACTGIALSVHDSTTRSSSATMISFFFTGSDIFEACISGYCSSWWGAFLKMAFDSWAQNKCGKDIIIALVSLFKIWNQDLCGNSCSVKPFHNGLSKIGSIPLQIDPSTLLVPLNIGRKRRRKYEEDPDMGKPTTN